jgi:glycoside/pentoside/hexuronide:cation symporter, GPH family
MYPLTRKTIWSYGAGNLGYGLVSQIMAIYFVFYATAVLGMSGTSVGLLVSIGIIWDAFSDPVMGYLSDHTRSKRFGRRHLYLLIGGIGVAVLHIFLWNISPGLSNRVKWYLMVLFVLAIKTFITIYITPYTALAAEISDDYTDRTRIQAVKTAFFITGIFMAAAFGMAVFFRSTELYPMGQLNPSGYRNISVFGSVFMLISMTFAYFGTNDRIDLLNDRILSNQELTIGAFFSEMRSAYANRDFRAVAVGYLFTNVSSALLSTLALHVYTFTFHMNNYAIAVIVGIQLLMSVLSQPFWIRYSDRFEKKGAINAGITLAAVGSVYFILSVLFRTTVQSSFLWLIPFSIIAGFGTGGLFTIPQAMVADTVDSNAVTSGKRQEGVFYGILTLTYKLSQSIAIFLLGIALDLLRFDPDLPAQMESTVIGLGLLMSLGSLASFGFSYLFYRSYSLTRKRMYEIHESIEQLSRRIKEDTE